MNTCDTNASKERYVHFSIDDVIEPIKDLFENNYQSIFCQYFFAFLRSIHLKYGIVFSCYFLRNDSIFDIKTMDSRYRNEFLKNSNWLKIGFHGFENMMFIDSKEKIDETFIIFENSFGDATIDRFPRLHRFACTKKTVEILKKNRVVGLLSSDDNRINYSLTKEDNDLLNANGYFYQKDIELFFLKTSYRIENIFGVKTSQLTNFNEKTRWLIVFTHCCFIRRLRNFHFWRFRLKIKQLARCFERTYSFDYPQNHIDELKQL